MRDDKKGEVRVPESAREVVEVVDVPHVSASYQGHELPEKDADGLYIPVVKRQQTQDFLGMLRLLAEPGGCATDLFMLMEDDFVMCPGSLAGMRESLAYARARFDDPTFRGVRVAVGLNGLILRCRDVPDMIGRVVLGPAARVPVDYLLAASFKASGALIVTRRAALMTHVGERSTIGNDPALLYVGTNGPAPSCGEMLSHHITVALEEHFSLGGCCDSQFSPCEAPNDKHPVLAEDPQRRSRHREEDMDLAAPVAPTMGEPSENCDTVCERHGMLCNASRAAEINQCNVLRHTVECDKTCVTQDGMDLPGVITVSDGPGSLSTRCILSSCIRSFQCQHFFKGTSRLCPCAKRKER